MPEEKNSMLLGAAMLGMAAVEEVEGVKEKEEEGEGLKAVVCRLQGVSKVVSNRHKNYCSFSEIFL